MNTLQLFAPAHEPAAPPLWRPIQVYLEHLGLRVEAEGFSRDNFENRRRALSRFAMAWSVVLPGGRHVLVPAFEESHAVVTTKNGRKRNVKRRDPLKYGARDAAEAVEQAERLAGSLGGLGIVAAAGQAVVRRNGDRPFGEANGDDLSRWCLANPQWKSGHTKKNNLLAILDCFQWYADEFDLRCPYKRKKVPKFVTPARREATEAEYIALMGHESSRSLRRALWCLWNLGIRTCEMREMVWSDFDWSTGSVSTYKHKNARKTNNPRLIALTPRQYRFFRNLYRQRPPWPDFVFLNTAGQAWTRRSFALHLRRTAARLGLDEGVAQKVSAYCLRHSFATGADEAGVKHEDAASLMGHTPEMFEQVYSKAPTKVRHVRKTAVAVESGRRQARLGREDQRTLFEGGESVPQFK